MPHFFLILFKVNVVLLLFALTYLLVLRKLTFYTLNRAFLVFGILFSTVYPFINLTGFFADRKFVQSYIPQFKQNISQLVQNSSYWSFWQVLIVIFYIGLSFMLIRLIIQFISLRSIHVKSSPAKIRNLKVRILKGKVSPFSFWQTIYINPDLHTKDDLKNILEHEKVHVEELHTFDIILAEISLALYWFNPGVWLMKNAVKENIEFITDAKILKNGIDKKNYQYSLLDVGKLQPSVAIVNNFNISDLKKRILMMNKKRSSKIKLSLYAIFIPVILIITLAFTVDSKTVKYQLTNLSSLSSVSKNVIQSITTTEQPKQASGINKPLKDIKVVSKKQSLNSVSSITNINSSVDSAVQQPKNDKVIKSMLLNLSGSPVRLNIDSLKGNEHGDNIAVSQKKVSVKLKVMRFNKDSVVVFHGQNMQNIEDLKDITIDPENIKSITITGTGGRKVIRIESKN